MNAPDSSEARAAATEAIESDARAVLLALWEDTDETRDAATDAVAALAAAGLLADPAPVPDQQAVALFAASEALNQAADAYEQGGWINAKRHARRDLTPDGVGHWLRNRASALTATAPPVDPYCPEHGTLPTTYDECSCRARALTATAQPAGGEER